MKVRIRNTFVWVEFITYTSVSHEYCLVRTEQGVEMEYPVELLTNLSIIESIKESLTKFFYHYFSTNMLGIDWAKIKKLWKSK